MAKKNNVQYIGIVATFSVLSIGAVLFSEKQSEKQIVLSQIVMPQIMTIKIMGYTLASRKKILLFYKLKRRENNNKGL